MYWILYNYLNQCQLVWCDVSILILLCQSMASNCQFVLAPCPRAHSCETSVFCSRRAILIELWQWWLSNLISCSELAWNFSWRAQAKPTVLSCTLFAFVRNLDIRKEEPFSSTRAAAMMMIILSCSLGLFRTRSELLTLMCWWDELI